MLIKRKSNPPNLLNPRFIESQKQKINFATIFATKTLNPDYS